MRREARKGWERQGESPIDSTKELNKVGKNKKRE